MSFYQVTKIIKSSPINVQCMSFYQLQIMLEPLLALTGHEYVCQYFWFDEKGIYFILQCQIMKMLRIKIQGKGTKCFFDR